MSLHFIFKWFIEKFFFILLKYINLLKSFCQIEKKRKFQKKITIFFEFEIFENFLSFMVK